jgi:phage terminase large subunit
VQLTNKELNLLETSNPEYIPLYNCQARYLVLKGGGGSGKSIFAGRKVLERVAENQYHNFLVVRKVARTIRDSCFAQLKTQIYQYFNYEDFKINKSDMSITHKNGNKVLFAGLDDVEKLKSIFDITDIWIEEATEITQDDFDQLDIRCRGIPSDYSQIIITFNPVSILHWLKIRFFDNPPDNCVTHESTYKDNLFLSPEAINVLKGFQKTNPYYYSVYCLGEWGVTGKTVFNAELVTKRLREIEEPKRYRFDYQLSVDVHTMNPVITDIQLVEDPNGFIRLYKLPEAKQFYVIGGDTAAEGSDEFVGQCMDNTSLEQVAVLNHKFNAHNYADQMYCMGVYYNTALLSIETNAGGTFVIERLQQLGYPNIYVRETHDTYREGYQKSYGFNTNVATRKPLIDNLVEIMDTELGINTINDKKTLEEMLTFVRNERGRPEAEEGAHDDHVMALGIAHYTRHQQQVYISPQKIKEYIAFDDEDEKKYNQFALGGEIEVI